MNLVRIFKFYFLNIVIAVLNITTHIFTLSLFDHSYWLFLFIWQPEPHRDRERGKAIINLLVHSPNIQNSRSLDQPEIRSLRLIQFSSVTWETIHYFPWCALAGSWTGSLSETWTVPPIWRASKPCNNCCATGSFKIFVNNT